MAKSTSLFDDIFKLQSTAPELDVDPEDPEDGFTAALVEQNDDGAEVIGSSSLRKKSAIILDDPRYKGKKTSRKELYSDEEEQEPTGGEFRDEEEELSSVGSLAEESEDAVDDDDEEDENEDDSQDGTASEDYEMEEKEENDNTTEAKDAVILPPFKSDDREKGKAVQHQLALWDDLIKCRISMQNLIASCNQLPQQEMWPVFHADPHFKTEAKNTHSTVRKLTLSLLDVQSALCTKTDKGVKAEGDDDEEITSESEDDIEEKITNGDDEKLGTNGSVDEMEDLNDEEDDEGENEAEEDGSTEAVGEQNVLQGRTSRKRKLLESEIEETVSKRHEEFQTYRNDTLAKWDEKTRLAHGKIKSKNFAAFEMSVLKQIEQVLANRERLLKRIHQQRAVYRILGRLPEAEQEGGLNNQEVEDDDDDVELQQKKPEVVLDREIIDDTDFYHMCLRDLIEMKQNEETDPASSNKHWLEIQRLRNKQKRKVDTRASKGRKIRYNVKEKLKNLMAPYDKSVWTDEQKDDLFKALFGGKNLHSDAVTATSEMSPIVFGL